MPYRRVDHGFLERIHRIHLRLQRYDATNCTQLAKEFEVSRKTIVRDIGYMRERLNLPIEFDSQENTYYYTESVDSFPTVQVTEGEVFALMVARKALDQYRGTTFHKQLSTSFDKLAAGLRQTVSFSPSPELDAVSFKNIGTGKSDNEVFNDLSRAVQHRFEIEFDYRKPGAKEPALRRVQPYHLANRDNLWYLVAFDSERAAIRTFAVPRITHVVVSDTTFQRAADFSPEKFFANALGVVSGDREYKVIIRFSAAVADRVREREWHESQKLKDLPGGDLELTLQLGALHEVERWVLRWGADAEVLQPKQLRDQLRQTLAALAAKYAE